MNRALRVVLVGVVVGVLSGCGGAQRSPGPTASGVGGTTTAPVPVSEQGIFGPPTADAPADRPRGVVLLLQGGAWVASTDEVLRITERGTALYRAHGFATDVVRLAAGRGTVGSAAAAYDEMRRRFGADTPICVVGDSSGGHVGLLLALARPDVSCVVVNAAPTDLRQWIREVPGAAAPVHAAFGDALRRFSPALHADRIRAPVLLQYAAKDPAVPIGEARTFLRGRPDDTTLVTLAPGNAFFVHSGVDRAEHAEIAPRQLRFVEAAARSRP